MADGMAMLGAAAALFTASHIGLPGAPRRPLVRRLGEGGYRLLFSVIALGSFVWLVNAWKATPAEPLWVPPAWAWHVAPITMLLAAVLFVGSISRANAALAGAPGASRPTGVLRITRHPMMWSFALWAVVHAWLSGTAATLVLAAAVAVTALGGAALQEGRKAVTDPGWRAYAAETSFLPFARGHVWPGWVPLIGGAALLAVATWAHPHLGAPAVPPWVWQR
ncbi:MAG: NnrU family protein [Sphingomonadaceae bacterium]|nr:NnrU family protein [Sphingomonadaceae bacterium]